LGAEAPVLVVCRRRGLLPVHARRDGSGGLQRDVEVVEGLLLEHVLFFTHLLTFPTSVVHSDWPGYSEAFDEAKWKSIVWHALPSVMLTVVIQTVLVVAVVWLLVSLIRWARPQPWTT
jgi:hypothetical protein